MAKAENNPNIPKTGAGKMSAEKKKTVIALALILIMASLWVKNVMKKNSICDAQALLMAQQNTEVPKEPKFSYVELPEMKDRHDVISRNVFVTNRWKGFRREGDMGNDYWTAQALSGGQAEGFNSIERVVQEMSLGAIVLGAEPRAFIGGQMVRSGEKFTFKYSHQSYEFKMLKIYDDKVELECDGTIVVKKIKQPQNEDD